MSVTVVNEENFAAEVISADKPVLVDFWATWCGPCKRLSPMVDEVSEEVSDVKFCKCDVDDNPDLAQKYGIMSIPTLLVFKNGEVVNQSVGAVPKDKLLQLIKV